MEMWASSAIFFRLNFWQNSIIPFVLQDTISSSFQIFLQNGNERRDGQKKEGENIYADFTLHSSGKTLFHPLGCEHLKKEASM